MGQKKKTNEGAAMEKRRDKPKTQAPRPLGMQAMGAEMYEQIRQVMAELKPV